MKKILLTVTFFALVLILASAANAINATTFGPGLQVQGTTKFLPTPAEPGRPLDAWVVFKKVVRGTADDTECRLADSYPFISTEGNDSKVIGSLSEGQEVTLRFKLRVDEKAPIGNSNLAVECKAEMQPWAKIEIPVSVMSTSAQLVVNEAALEPSFLPPGGVSTLKIKLSNPTGLQLRNLRVKLDFTSSDLPIAPFQSNAQKVVNQLNPGEEIDVIYTLTASSDAASKLYKVQLAVNYQDSVGNNFQINDAIGIIVRSSPDVKILLDESTVYKAGQNGKVILRIVNRGSSSVKALEVTMLPTRVDGSQSTVLTVGSKVEYISSINGEEDDTVEFNVFTLQDAKEKVLLPVLLSFKDSAGTNYSQMQEVEIPIYSQTDALKYDLEKQAGIGLAGAVVILLILGFVTYKYVLPRLRNH